MKIKEKIFEFLFNRNKERNVRFPSFDKPLKILVLFESDVMERNEVMKTIRQDLLRRKMDVTMWGYVDKKEIDSPIMLQSRILGQNDYNWLGKPKDQVVEDLKSVHYDLLIDLTTKPLLPLRYLAMYADADFKAGLNIGEGVHDMLISLPDLDMTQDEGAHIEATWLYDQLMKYLTTIKSND